MKHIKIPFIAVLLLLKFSASEASVLHVITDFLAFQDKVTINALSSPGFTRYGDIIGELKILHSTLVAREQPSLVSAFKVYEIKHIRKPLMLAGISCQSSAPIIVSQMAQASGDTCTISSAGNGFIFPTKNKLDEADRLDQRYAESRAKVLLKNVLGIVENDPFFVNACSTQNLTRELSEIILRIRCL